MRPCEDACTRREVNGEAVAIRALKRFLADHDNGSGLDLTASPARPGRVAIIGSGPAGMMAAWDLRRRGFAVTIYESAAVPGGMLAQAIPAYRLPAAVVERECGYLERIGVELRCSTTVGADVALAELVAGHDAVLIAAGAPLASRLGLSGEDAGGVFQGLDFLRTARRAPGSLAVGQHVLVIGGGNVAVDVSQTAVRLGARQVQLVCLEQRQQMPAFAWEIEDAVADGVELLSGWGPRRLVAEAGRVRGVELQRCTAVFDDRGAFRPAFDELDRRDLDADAVIVAIGQRAAPDFLAGSGIEVAGGWIVADPLTYQTSETKIFAAGDAVTGPRSAVEAMAAGRTAAESIRRLIEGEDLRYGRAYQGPYLIDLRVDRAGATRQPRAVLPRPARDGLWSEIEGGMTAEQAMAEGSRCLSCGRPEGYYRTCWFCLPCEIECPEEALHVEIPYLLR